MGTAEEECRRLREELALVKAVADEAHRMMVGVLVDDTAAMDRGVNLIVALSAAGYYIPRDPQSN